MGNFRKALMSTISEVSVFVGPKTTAKAVVATGDFYDKLGKAVDKAMSERKARKSEFIKIMEIQPKSK